MESLYAKYIKEREEYEIVEDDFGFATYKFYGRECYIRDLYVVPEYRRTKVATQYADKISKIAKDAGCTCLVGTVFPKASGSTESTSALIAYGFKIFESQPDKIIFIKELQ